MAERITGNTLDLAYAAAPALAETIGGMGKVQSVVERPSAETPEDDDVFYDENSALMDSATIEGPSMLPCLRPVPTGFPVNVEHVQLEPARVDEWETLLDCNSSLAVKLLDAQAQTEPLAQTVPTEDQAQGESVNATQEHLTDPTTEMQTQQETVFLHSAEEEDVAEDDDKAPTVAPTTTPENEPSEETDEMSSKEMLYWESLKDDAGEKPVNGSHRHSSQSLAQLPGEAPPASCHGTISRYNTVSYRKIRKGNTRQKIHEFESMMQS